MALAILQWESADSHDYLFKIDIGTNNFYRFKIGRQVIERAGIKWVDEISRETPFRQKTKLTFLGDSEEEVRLPKNYFDQENCYVQLLSAKDARGTSPAVSKVIRIPAALRQINTGRLNPLTRASSIIMSSIDFNPVRNISHSEQSLSHQSSIEDLLGSLVRAVLPAAINMLSPAPSSSGGTASPSGNTTSMLTSLLGAMLRAVAPNIPGLPLGGSLSGQQSVNGQRFMNGQGSFSGQQSVNGQRLMNGQRSFSGEQSVSDNRFHYYQNTQTNNKQFSRPFIFGIDDALLATLAGPIIQQGMQLLPQLINAANQHKLQTLQANNQLMTTLAGDVQRRMMLQQLMQNQPQAAATVDPAVLAQLIAQLQNTPAPAVAPAAPVVAAAHSLQQSAGGYGVNGQRVPAYSLSNAVILTFESLKLSPSNGKDVLLLQLSDRLVFKIKLNVSNAPKNPLPKAIYNFYFKDATTKQLLFEKTFKQKDIRANTVIEFEFLKSELSNMPLHKNIEVFAEMRWRTSSEKEYKAIGNTSVVFVQNYFVQNQGEAVSDEKELTDMKVYRSFWNKIWQSPSLGKSKSLWELNVDARYLVSLSAEQPNNGITSTKIAMDEKDSESNTDKTAGRLKAGIELSITEINKLMDGWDGNTPLEDEKLAAIRNADFARPNTAEMIYNIKLKGRTYEQGMVWIVPVFRLFEITLGKVESLTPEGYVNQVSSTKVKFPLPVSARILGIKSNNQ
ncbi:hypothetical protein SAMN05518672_103463 [Chitinophaga sp. CF118]|uniref:hypothetical protein n=1 Tax=Chitinophaga sp. CF118 TaxID=1884367 RepID=UPI0008E18190|nr:hypothetical protein [Chitinophaga sp. CF118]SFD84166.1 hypothetical protein SAMN05518672_103463 [Chitinophaga sp. CF118]